VSGVVVWWCINCCVTSTCLCSDHFSAKRNRIVFTGETCPVVTYGHCRFGHIYSWTSIWALEAWFS
jgi:hypothetical protein